MDTTGGIMNQYKREANQMCNVLVNEVAKASTWASMQDAIWAIQRVRSSEKNHIAEWEHLNNPSPSDQSIKPSD